MAQGKPQYENLGGVVPENLVRDLDKFAAWEPADSPRAAAIKQAADVLRNLPARQSDAKRLEDSLFQAKGYRIDAAPSTDPKERSMRLVVFGDKENKRVLSFSILTPPDAYEMAQRLIREYDRLEGIK